MSERGHEKTTIKPKTSGQISSELCLPLQIHMMLPSNTNPGKGGFKRTTYRAEINFLQLDT